MTFTAPPKANANAAKAREDAQSYAAREIMHMVDLVDHMLADDSEQSSEHIHTALDTLDQMDAAWAVGEYTKVLGIYVAFRHTTRGCSWTL